MDSEVGTGGCDHVEDLGDEVECTVTPVDDRSEDVGEILGAFGSIKLPAEAQEFGGEGLNATGREVL
ncbi:hypothetical protein ACQEWB_31005 [Streptomyces sp. CA-249302]|uniref:hypothetical protein n=1 Tax=Streptomyces sp. CA-249302 TaxID=3240058 RepID=UPI003D93F6F4